MGSNCCDAVSLLQVAVLASLPALLAESCGTQICHDYAVTVTLMVFVVMLQPPT